MIQIFLASILFIIFFGFFFKATGKIEKIKNNFEKKKIKIKIKYRSMSEKEVAKKQREINVELVKSIKMILDEYKIDITPRIYKATINQLDQYIKDNNHINILSIYKIVSNSSYDDINDDLKKKRE